MEKDIYSINDKMLNLSEHKFWFFQGQLVEFPIQTWGGINQRHSKQVNPQADHRQWQRFLLGLITGEI